jgi:succinate dehydrogenase assembly factor 2
MSLLLQRSVRNLAVLRPALRSSSPASAVGCLRFYKGEAGEAPPVLSEKEIDLLSVAKPRSDEIRAKHLKMPDGATIPRSSWDPNSPVPTDNVEIRRKRLVYRSKQRGWLEVDLLLGTWAHENVHKLSPSDLDDYERFVNLETIDIYNVITLRLDVPEDMKTASGDGVVERIQIWARGSPLGKADPEKYKQVKADNKLI